MRRHAAKPTFQAHVRCSARTFQLGRAVPGVAPRRCPGSGDRLRRCSAALAPVAFPADEDFDDGQVDGSTQPRAGQLDPDDGIINADGDLSPSALLGSALRTRLPRGFRRHPRRALSCSRTRTFSPGSPRWSPARPLVGRRRGVGGEGTCSPSERHPVGWSLKARSDAGECRHGRAEHLDAEGRR